jgi:hypothetical protein
MKKLKKFLPLLLCTLTVSIGFFFIFSFQKVDPQNHFLKFLTAAGGMLIFYPALSHWLNFWKKFFNVEDNKNS